MPRGRQITDEPTPSTPPTNGHTTVKPPAKRRRAKASPPARRSPKKAQTPRPKRDKKELIKRILRLVWRFFAGSSTPRKQDSPTGTAVITAEPKPKRQWMKPWKRLTKPRKKKEKKVRPGKVRRSWKSRTVTGLLLFAMIFWTFGFFVARVANTRITQETSARKSVDAQQASQMKAFGQAINFPKADAAAKAVRLATECFTVPSYGGDNTDDQVYAQNKALRNANIPVGDNINCGWDGKGRGLASVVQVVDDPTVDRYWIRGNRATIILQVKLYQSPGWFYYYVPFENDHGTAKFAGMPAIFGTGSGALNFMDSCPDTSTSPDTNKMKSIAQRFLNGLAGDKSIDLGYLVYGDHGDTKFGGFGPVVSNPKVTQVKYCGAKGAERRFAALVQLNGPVEGAHYTLPYGFGVIPNAQIGGKYQVKDFGPAPGYSGE
jgi:hypothetical protein